MRPVHIYTTFGSENSRTDGIELNFDGTNLDLKRFYIITTDVLLSDLLSSRRNTDLTLVNVFL